MASEDVVTGGTSVIGGAGAGAAIGAEIGALGGPIGIVGGAVIGGAVGLVAGAFGIGSNKKKRKARKLAAQSRAIQNLILRKGLVVDYIQSSAVAAVGAVASGAGTQNTSGSMGVLSSLQTQALSALKVNAELFKRNESVIKLQEQAEKLSAISSGIMSAGQAAGSFLASPGMDWGKAATTPKYVGNPTGYGGYSPSAPIQNTPFVSSF